MSDPQYLVNNGQTMEPEAQTPTVPSLWKRLWPSLITLVSAALIGTSAGWLFSDHEIADQDASKAESCIVMLLKETIAQQPFLDVVTGKTARADLDMSFSKHVLSNISDQINSEFEDGGVCG